ncbi:hypothetical protein BGZ59_006851 [Podila verticillata]|nr:hypothetical protein BGZ59_006851 [Podila verticillata]
MSNATSHIYVKPRNSNKGVPRQLNSNNNTAFALQPRNNQYFNWLRGSTSKPSSTSFSTPGSFPATTPATITPATTAPKTNSTTISTASATQSTGTTALVAPTAAPTPIAATTTGAATATPSLAMTKAPVPASIVTTLAPPSTASTSARKSFVPLSPTTGVFGSGSAAAGTAPATATVGALFGPSAANATPTSGKVFEQPSFSSASATTTGGLIGAPSTTTTPPTGGFFGAPGGPSGATPVTNNPGHIFETHSTNITTTGLFGSPVTLSAGNQTAHSALSLTFRIAWPDSAASKEQCHEALIKSKDGNLSFICTVHELFGFNFFLTATTVEQFNRLGMFKGAVIQDMQRTWTVYAALTQPLGSSLQYRMSVFPKESMVAKDGVYEVQIMLTNQPAAMVQSDPAYHCETLLERLLQDSASHDVFFEFEVTEDASAMNSITNWSLPRSKQKQPSDDVDLAEEKPSGGWDMESDDGSGAAKKQTVSGGQDSKGKDKVASSLTPAESSMPALENTENDLNPTIKDNQVSRTVTVGAHLSVLSQYKYFESTFSPIMDRSAGKAVIRMTKDEPAVFRLLLQFLYLGQLKPRTSPLFVTRDILAQDSRGVPTWEDMLLIAHRYEVPELAALAADKIAANLDGKWAIPFLFRTGHKFSILRQDVIRFVVANNMPLVVQKAIQQTYLTHPECSAIFGEIMAELWSLHTQAAPPPLESGATFGAKPFSSSTYTTSMAASAASGGPIPSCINLPTSTPSTAATVSSPTTNSRPLFSIPKTTTTTTTSTTPLVTNGLLGSSSLGFESPFKSAKITLTSTPMFSTGLATPSSGSTTKSGFVFVPNTTVTPAPMFTTGLASTTAGSSSTVPASSTGTPFSLPRTTATSAPIFSTGLGSTATPGPSATSSGSNGAFPKTQTLMSYSGSGSTAGSSPNVPTSSASHVAVPKLTGNHLGYTISTGSTVPATPVPSTPSTPPKRV